MKSSADVLDGITNALDRFIERRADITTTLNSIAESFDHSEWSTLATPESIAEAIPYYSVPAETRLRRERENPDDPEFNIPVVWTMTGTFTVRAPNLEAAKESARDNELPANGYYLEDSFEIDEDLLAVEHPRTTA